MPLGPSGLKSAYPYMNLGLILVNDVFSLKRCPPRFQIRKLCLALRRTKYRSNWTRSSTFSIQCVCGHLRQRFGFYSESRSFCNKFARAGTNDDAIMKNLASPFSELELGLKDIRAVCYAESDGVIASSIPFLALGDEDPYSKAIRADSWIHLLLVPCRLAAGTDKTDSEESWGAGDGVVW